MDSNPSLNLASFVTTFMEPEVEAIMMENMNKNHIDVECVIHCHLHCLREVDGCVFVAGDREYPGAAELETRCVSIIG